jgi:hypothetical protein
MHDVDERHVRRGDNNSDLFLGLPHRGGIGRLPGLHMPGWKGGVTVHVAGIRPDQQQHTTIRAGEEQMCVSDERSTFTRVTRSTVADDRLPPGVGMGDETGLAGKEDCRRANAPHGVDSVEHVRPHVGPGPVAGEVQPQAAG